MTYKLHSDYAPTGDQPEAIRQLTEGIRHGMPAQTLLGVTGSGKTFTIANVIKAAGKPALILSHNKTLAAQLYAEFKGFFPENAVEYYVSYYDYYQPEAYIASTDTYIEKDLAINEDIDKLRLAATSALLSGRKDVIVVSSVSCIYGMGNPSAFYENVIALKVGQRLALNVLLRRLVDSLYTRNDVAPKAGDFRVKGDTVDIFLAYADDLLRVTFWDDEIERIEEVDALTGHRMASFSEYKVYPANLFLTSKETQEMAIRQIQDDLTAQVEHFNTIGKTLEAKRLNERVNYDIEMIRELGGHRKLLALLRRPQARHTPLLPARLLPRRLPHRHRREPRHGAADTRHVRRRPLPKGIARGVWLSPAGSAGQSPADLRRVSRHGQTGHLRQRHAGGV